MKRMSVCKPKVLNEGSQTAFGRLGRDQSLFSYYFFSYRQQRLSTGEYIATSRRGFIHQIVSAWVRNDYYFYVQGKLPKKKGFLEFDRKIITRYPVVMKASRRYSRKKRDIINVAYLRYERYWIMLATRGKHEETKEGLWDWRAAEAMNIRNCRRGQPIRFFGYSISSGRGDYILKRKMRNPDGPPERDNKYRVRVQISRKALQQLRTELLSQARIRREDWFRSYFWNLPYEPYAPVRKQLLRLLRQINASRSAVGLSKLPSDIIRMKQQRVKVFITCEP